MRAFTWILIAVAMLSSSAFAQTIHRPGPTQPSPLIDSARAEVASLAAQPRWTDPQPSKVVKGTVVGLIVGAAAGIVVGAVYCDGWHCAQAEAGFAVLLGGVGAGIGALAGSLDAWGAVGPGRHAGTCHQAAAVGRRRVSVTWRF